MCLRVPQEVRTGPGEEPRLLCVETGAADRRLPGTTNAPKGIGGPDGFP